MYEHKALNVTPTIDLNGNPNTLLGGSGDLESKLVTQKTTIVTLVIPIINLLTKSP